MARPYGQIKRVRSDGSPTEDMWIFETSDREGGGHLPKQPLQFKRSDKKVFIQMAGRVDIDTYNVMIGSSLVPIKSIKSIRAMGNGKRIEVTFARDEISTSELYIYVWDPDSAEFEPVYLLEEGDQKPTVLRVGAFKYSPPPVVIGGGVLTPTTPEKGSGGERGTA